MDKLAVKNVVKTALLNLKERKMLLIIWTAIMAGVMLMYIAMFPLIKQMFGEQTMIPPEFAQIFGDSMKQLTDPNFYFASIWQQAALALCGYAAFTGASIFSNEENSGASEYLYSLPVTRTETFLGKLLFGYASILLINLAAGVVSVLVLVALGESVKIGAVILCFLFSFFASAIFTGIGAMVSAMVKKERKSAGIGVGVFLGTFVFGILGGLGINKLEFFKYFSPGNFLGASEIMTSSLGLGSEPIHFIVWVLLPILLIVPPIIGFIFYRKKDIA